MSTQPCPDKGAEAELLPCPFCGGTDAFIERLNYEAAYVQCDSSINEHDACLARGPIGVQEDEDDEIPGAAAAIRAWNEQSARHVALPADVDAEGLPPPPTLPRYLLDQIGEYGVARTDTVGQIEVQYRWEVLISYIKRYAADYASSAIAADRKAQAGAVQQPAAAGDLTEVARAVIEQLEKSSSKPDAPGHSHQVAGVWDIGNKPEIAGKSCEWCALWSRFKRLAAPAPGNTAQQSEKEKN